MMFRHGLLFAFLLAVFAAGCTKGPATKDQRGITPEDESGKKKAGDNDKGKASKEGSKEGSARRPRKKRRLPRGNPSVKATTQEGVIEGRVSWKGPRPEASPDARGRMVMRNGTPVAVEPLPRLKVGSSGGVANVVVWLANPPRSAALNPAEQVQIKQQKGNYRPHIQLAPVGSRLRLLSSDDTADFHVSGSANVTRVLRRGKSSSVPLNRPGLVEVASETRPWMTHAYVWVVEHPYHDITTTRPGRSGRFRFTRIPPGEYELRMWQEGWGAQSKPRTAKVMVKLAAGKGADVRWVLKP
jgi:hypothetical protein